MDTEVKTKEIDQSVIMNALDWAYDKAMFHHSVDFPLPSPPSRL